MKIAKKILSSLFVILLAVGLFSTAVPAPASAGTTLTISVSGSVDQQVLESFIEQILQKYNLNPDTINIKYPDGTVDQFDPNPAPPQPAPQPKPQPQPQPQPAPDSGSDTSFMNADEQRMLDLVNEERVKVGLPPFKANPELVRLARLKAQDMINLGYFAHTSPTYGSPFEMMKAAGVAYSYAGENLAGAYNVDVAHNSLMNSPGHRANILNSNFKEVGIGVVDGGPYGKMFVQMFIG